MTRRLSLLLLICLFFSCKKEEQSCTDGIFTPEKEIKTDCGGVCPPCDFKPTVIESYLSTKINGESVAFGKFALKKTPNWILSFSNDSIAVQVNLGDGDSLGGRAIKETNSTASYLSKNYTDLDTGIVVFSEINHSDQFLSGFFKAQFVLSSNIEDTFHITDGQFEKIYW